MEPFPFNITLTSGALLFCLIIVAFLIRRIVNRIRKSTGYQWAIYLYLLIGIWPIFEVVKSVSQDFPWFRNPFFYFWLILLIYCGTSFYLEYSKQKENRNG